MRISRYISLFLLLPALLIGCAKEVQDDVKPEVTGTIPFSVTVQADPVTRASFDGSSLGIGNYVFAAGDKLYITGHNGDISGELTLISGAGTGTATFGGPLTIINNYEPTAETILSATLVGESQVGTFFTISDKKITAGPTYPSSSSPIPYTSSLTDLVQQYSHFTASFTYNVRRFTLTQQTVFLNFVLELYRSDLDLSGESPTVQVDIKSSDGNSVLQSVTAVPVGGSSVISRIEFTSVFPSGTALRGAKVVINNNGGIHCEPDFASDLDLLANHYYRVSRSAVEDFIVEARNSGASVTFNYATDGNIQYRTYSGGVWSDWLPYSSSISLSAGEKVSFRGQRASYTNNGSTPLITVTNPVYIYGDIMSLMCNANWVRQSAVSANAFKQAFKDCDNIDIHPDSDKDLFLSAETLNASCYEGMFQGCTGLTKTPKLPSTSLATSCYKNMFSGCSSITSLPSGFLPATTLAASCYEGMFSNCTSLATIPSGLLPATTLADMCYHRMFLYCAFTNLPSGLLPATNLAFGCYWKMFEDCRSLQTVPNNLLPAMNLATACYARMFFRCTSLQGGPDLPAINAAPACYFVMFRNCAAIKYVKCMLYLDETQRNGSDKDSALSTYNKTEDPPEDNLRTWTVIDFWTVFNKWLTKSPNGESYNVPNNNTCEYVYNSAMPPSVFSISIAGATLIPSNWVKTPVAP